MNKSEKSFYVIIENKKCGKFSGVGPIQVAKKVASKKLKSKKKTEITFHLDEVGGKKKRYGPYQGRKDKKTRKVVVVKGGKIMKGGVLTANDLTKLQKAFISNCNITLNKGTIAQSFQKRIIDIPFGFISTKPLIFFNLENTGQTVKKTFENTIFQGIVYEYKYAVFEDTNGNIWIFFKNKDNQVLHNNFFEFFLNPEIIQLSFDRLTREQLIEVLQNLNVGNNPIRPELKRIIKYANQILKILRIFLLSPDSIESIIYCPNNSEPKIKKCVYPDLTFGILDGETPVRIPQNNNYFSTPKSPYQRFLILTNTGMSGISVNEPIIYVRVPIIPQIQLGGMQTVDQIQAMINNLKTQLQELEIQQHFDCCIFSFGYNQLKIMFYDNNPTQNFSLDNIIQLININTIVIQNLIDIPLEFGNFKRIRNLIETIKKQQQQQQQSFSQQPQQFTLQPLSLNANMRKIQKQTELLQELANLKQELERLKTEQTSLTRPSVFSKSITSLINNPYPNLKLKPTNIPTIETRIKQIEQQIINSMQSR